MPRITYQDEAVIEVDTVTPILHASLQHGIPHTHVCGGNARCSTCRVLILDGLENLCPRNEKEQKLSLRRNFSSNVRLACQTTLQGDVVLRRLVVDDEDRRLVDQEINSAAPRSVGEERLLAILFADIRDFTPFSEAHLPYDVIHALNRYFDRVGAIVEQHHGRIDSFIGDGIMALFGLDDPANGVLNAVQAGLDMLSAVEAMQPYFEAQFRTHLRIGVGLHYGEAVLGAIGTGDRRRLTAIGDAVNVASRVESANKAAGTSFLITQRAYQQVSERITTGLSVQLPLKGKTGVFQLLEVTGLAAVGAPSPANRNG